MQLGRWYHSCSYRFATVSKWLDIDKLDARLWWTPWRRSSPCCWAIIFAIDATVPGCACTRMMLMCARAHTLSFTVWWFSRAQNTTTNHHRKSRVVCIGIVLGAITLPSCPYDRCALPAVRRCDAQKWWDGFYSMQYRHPASGGTGRGRCTQAGCLCLQIIDNCCLQPSTIHPEAEMTQPAECVLSCGQLRMRVEWKGMKRWRWG